MGKMYLGHDERFGKVHDGGEPAGTISLATGISKELSSSRPSSISSTVARGEPCMWMGMAASIAQVLGRRHLCNFIVNVTIVYCFNTQ